MRWFATFRAQRKARILVDVSTECRRTAHWLIVPLPHHDVAFRIHVLGQELLHTFHRLCTSTCRSTGLWDAHINYEGVHLATPDKLKFSYYLVLIFFRRLALLVRPACTATTATGLLLSKWELLLLGNLCHDLWI